MNLFRRHDLWHAETATRSSGGGGRGSGFTAEPPVVAEMEVVGYGVAVSHGCLGSVIDC